MSGTVRWPPRCWARVWAKLSARRDDRRGRGREEGGRRRGERGGRGLTQRPGPGCEPVAGRDDRKGAGASPGGPEARGEVEVLPPGGRGQACYLERGFAAGSRLAPGLRIPAGSRRGASFFSSSRRRRPGSGLQDAGRPWNRGPWLFHGDLLATLLCLRHPHLLTSSPKCPE